MGNPTISRFLVLIYCRYVDIDFDNLNKDRLSPPAYLSY